MEFVFKVDESFHLKDRGITLVGFPENENIKIHIGDNLLLIDQTGKEMKTQLKGIELINFGPNRPDPMPLSLVIPEGVSNNKVASGTKLYKV